MFGGDVVLTWRPQNIVSIILMTVVAGFVIVSVRQIFKRFGGNSENG